MRARAVLTTTGEGAVDAYVKIAKKEATDKARAQGGDMAAMLEAAQKAEEQARAEAETNLVDYATVDTAPLSAAIDQVETAIYDYRVAESRAKAEYIESKRRRRRRKRRRRRSKPGSSTPRARATKPGWTTSAPRSRWTCPALPPPPRCRRATKPSTSSHF